MTQQGYKVKWDMDDTRFLYCEGQIFYSVAEAIVSITIKALTHRYDLIDEYNNDSTVYDVGLKTDVTVTFEEWIGIIIDNFCHFEKGMYDSSDFSIVGK